MRVDKAGPSFSFTTKYDNSSGSNYDYVNGPWTNRTIWRTMSASDNGSGVDHYEYSLDGSTWNVEGNSASWQYGGNGVNNAYFRAIDKVGNASNVVHAILRVDKAAPTCGGWSGESTSWTGGNRTISVGCNDSGGSGCRQSAYSVTYTTNTKTSTPSFTISDNAGNTNVCSKSVNVYVGKTANIVYQTYNGASTDHNISTVAAGYGPWINYNGGLSGRIAQASPVYKIYVSASSDNISGNVNYQVYQQSYATNNNPNGIGNGTWFGTDGKRIEAVRFWLTGDMANAFDIMYRVYVQGQGWLFNPAYNGNWAGSSGLCKKIEGIQIGIYPKGTTSFGWTDGGISSGIGATYLTDSVYSSCK